MRPQLAPLQQQLAALPLRSGLFLHESSRPLKFYYLYMMLDVFSRKITAWEVYEIECGSYAAQLLQRGVLAEGCASTLECLHADNGAIQKSSTLRAKMEWLGIEPSYSRPRA